MPSVTWSWYTAISYAVITAPPLEFACHRIVARPLPGEGRTERGGTGTDAAPAGSGATAKPPNASATTRPNTRIRFDTAARMVLEYPHTKDQNATRWTGRRRRRGSAP